MHVPDVLSWAADVGSLLGLVITCLVWRQTRALKKAFVLRARLPELSTALRAISSDLLKHLQDSSPDAQGLDAAIARLNALLANLSQKVDGSLHRMIQTLLGKSGGKRSKLLSWRGSGRSGVSVEQAWGVYGDVQGLLEALNQAAKDSKWS